MYLRTSKGIIQVPERRFIKSLLCNHKNHITGNHCTESGISRISGLDTYTVCLDCGKVLSEHHTFYYP